MSIPTTINPLGFDKIGGGGELPPGYTRVNYLYNETSGQNGKIFVSDFNSNEANIIRIKAKLYDLSSNTIFIFNGKSSMLYPIFSYQYHNSYRFFLFFEIIQFQNESY